MSAVHSISSLQEAADRNRLVEEAMGRFEKSLGRWPHKDGMLGEEARTRAARHDLERLNESRIFISKTLDTRNLRQFKTELLRLLDNTPENPLSQYTYECNILRQLNYVESSLKSRIRRFSSVSAIKGWTAEMIFLQFKIPSSAFDIRKRDLTRLMQIITKKVCSNEKTVPKQFKREWIDPIYRTLKEVRIPSLVWMAFYYQVQAVLNQALEQIHVLLGEVAGSVILPRDVVSTFLEECSAEKVIEQIGLETLLPPYGDWRDDFPEVKLKGRRSAFSIEKNLLHERTISSRHLALYGLTSRGTAREGGHYF
ncbi:hypothetical protein JCM5350_006313 [Sporobolomyces pararoseus]